MLRLKCIINDKNALCRRSIKNLVKTIIFYKRFSSRYVLFFFWFFIYKRNIAS